MIGITVQTPGALLSQRAAEAIQRPEVLRVGARGIFNALRDRFDELERTRPNKQGWPRTHTWSAIRRGVQNPVPAGEGMSVAVNHPAIAQIYFGGWIRPLHGSVYLTLAARAEAYGKRASEFSNLEFGMRPDEQGRMRPALVEPETTGIKFGKVRKDGTRRLIKGPMRGGVFYWLVRQAYQEGDKTILPTEAQLLEAARRPIEDYVEREVK